jgi:hypothetical protein
LAGDELYLRKALAVFTKLLIFIPSTLQEIFKSENSRWPTDICFAVCISQSKERQILTYILDFGIHLVTLEGRSGSKKQLSPIGPVEELTLPISLAIQASRTPSSPVVNP